MKTNVFSKIAMGIKNIGKSKLDFSHGVSTTATFGDMQPSHCKLIIPTSNGRVHSKSLVRFGTMLLPTFGKIKSKEYYQLVPVSDLLENVAPMLAQAKIANQNGEIIAPQGFPHMTLGVLSRYIMIGAKMQLFRHTNGSATAITMPTGQLPWTAVKQAAQNTGIINWFKDNANNPNSGANGNTRLECFDDMHCSWLDLGALNQNWFDALGERYQEPSALNGMHCWIPIANESVDSLFGCYHEDEKNDDGAVVSTLKYGTIVNPEKCDYCITFKVPLTSGLGYETFTLAMNLSAFGKRLRKAIIGAGKQINMMSFTPHHVVDLFAIWKAYFDLFGITLWTNYECTPLRKLTRYLDSKNWQSVDTLMYDHLWFDFILELGRMWYTDQQDAVGAMVTSTAVSPELNLANQFVDVDGVAHVEEVNSSNFYDALGHNGHAFIDAIKHGQLDAEYLQKLYVWTNRNTVIGKEIEKVLRAQGLGKFCDSCKSNFIGYHEELMQISDVVSTSDTYKDGQGSLLGTYGGRGIKLYETKDHSFSTDEYCFQVNLFTIVPECDFLQSIDPASYVIKKTDFHLPDFDGMGYEVMRKSMVCGAINWANQIVPAGDDYDVDSVEAALGMLPRGSHLKLAHAINNGEITLRSTRDGYLPLTVDKYINVGDYNFHLDFENASYKNFTLLPTIPAKDLPVGGYHYRYLCKYPWIGAFTRIFAKQNNLIDDTYWLGYDVNAQTQELGYELMHEEFDNFIVHQLVTAPVWSPCKAIEESFETFEDGEKPNASMEHA